MKKLLLFLLSLMILNSYSQIGIKAGTNYLGGDVIDYYQDLFGVVGFEDEFSAGYYVGILARYGLSSSINVRSDVSYQQVGLKFDFSNPTDDVKIKEKTNTLELLSGIEFLFGDAVALFGGVKCSYFLQKTTGVTENGELVDLDGDGVAESETGIFNRDTGEFDTLGDVLETVDRLFLKAEFGISFGVIDNLLLELRFSKTLADGTLNFDLPNLYTDQYIASFGVVYIFGN